MNNQKFSYLDSRFLMLKNDALQFNELGEAQVFITDHLSQNYYFEKDPFLIMAHPFRQGFTWSGEFPQGLDGIEVLNVKSLWQKIATTRKISILWSFLIYPFNPRLALIRLHESPEAEINLWDQLSNKRPTLGTVGSDVTIKTIPYLKKNIHFPSYDMVFGMASNHILMMSELTGDASKDRYKIIESLRKGQFYLSLDLIEDPKGFLTYVRGPGRKFHMMGSQIKFQKGLKIHIELAKTPNTPYEIVLIRNGERHKTFNKPEVDFLIEEPGVYRVLVRVIPLLPVPDGRIWLSWIYSNPFYIQAY